MKRYTTYVFIGFAISTTSLHADQPQIVKGQSLASITKQGTTDLRIGFINSFEAMRGCEQGKAITKTIEAKRTELTKELEEDQNAIMKAANDYQAKATVMSENARQDQEKNLRKMRVDYEAKVKESQYELETKISKDTEVLAHAVEQACKPLAEAQNLDVIIDEATGRAFYVRDEIRHTETLVAHMDKNHKNGMQPNATVVAQADIKGGSAAA